MEEGGQDTCVLLHQMVRSNKGGVDRFAYSLFAVKDNKPRNDNARRLLIYFCPIIATILRRVSTSIFSHAATT